MFRKSAVCVLSAAICGPAMAQGAEVLRQAVDPYIPGQERALFLGAAGQDSDLTEAEFTANANKDRSFVRAFDTWANITKFDNNKDGKVDWFEADAYRRALRAAVIKEYDANGNGRLDDSERVEAGQALAGGKVPALSSAAPARPAPAPGAGAGFRQGGGFGGGNFNPEQIRQGLAQGEEQRKQFIGGLLNEYDANGNGKIDPNERLNMPLQQQFIIRAHDIAMNVFDEDGDGNISTKEQDGVIAFMQEAQKTGQSLALKMFDKNGDGNITPDETAGLQQAAQSAAFSLLPKITSWVDKDGDGIVSESEREALIPVVADRIEANAQKFIKTADANGDGRLSGEERNALLKNVSDDIYGRYSKADANGDGTLSSGEIAGLLEGLAEEFGVKPGSNQ